MPNTSTSRVATITMLSLQCSKRSNVALPLSITNMLPSCATSCLGSYIQQAFIPSPCSNSSNVACLCSHYSNTGYTLGEIALACLKSGCPEASSAQASQAYQLCTDQPSSVAATHSALTLLNSAAPTISTTTISRNGPTFSARPSPNLSTQTALTISTITATDSMTPSATLSTSLTPTTSFTSPVSTAPKPDVTSTRQSTGILTTSQAIGVSIAAVSGVLVVIGIILIIVCIKRRKKKDKKSLKRQHSWDFVDHAPPHSFLSPWVDTDYRSRGPPAYPEKSGAPALGSKPLVRPPEAFMRPPQRPPSEAYERSASPNSIRSERTLSLLLPEKPPQSPHIVTQFARPFSTMSKGTMFEEDKTPGLPQVPFHIPPFPMPTSRPPHERLQTRRVDRSPTSSTDGPRAPNLCLRIPSQKTRYARLSSLTLPERQEDFTHITSPEQRLINPLSAHPPPSARNSMPPNSAATYLPSYYTSNDSRTPVLTQTSPPRVTRENDIPAIPRKWTNKSVRRSQASDTSFESVDSDEFTPPEEADKRLSILEETSPISGVRYPKIPRSANQVIPRSLPMRYPARPGSRLLTPDKYSRSPNLLSKRRASNAVSQPERNLDPSIESGSSTTLSTECSSNSDHQKRRDPAIQRGRRVLQTPFQTPLADHSDRGRIGRTLSPQFQADSGQEMALKSPLWEPKLTPTRRGDALFLSVALP